jgi:ubiquinone/menaquinone biosynthesis C-methylase UbiE
MDHTDHVNLLKPANLPAGGTWADFGAGSGAFTLALRELIGPEGTIYAVDKDRGALKRLESAYRHRFSSTDRLIPLNQDFSVLFNVSTSSTQRLPPLDGIVTANSLHYFKDQEKILRHVRGFLKPNGALLLVEYNVDTGNLWVPHPFSFKTFRSLAVQAGFSEPRLLATTPSSFLREFYSAVAYKQTRVAKTDKL